LKLEGFPEEEALNLIGYIVSAEIFEILKHQRPFNRERFVDALKRLPELPSD
jgi:hypothetical protein